MSTKGKSKALEGWGFKKCHILVIGDYMLDEYILGTADRISPEAPVPVVRVDKKIMQLGGAGNVVRNLHLLGVEFDSHVYAMGIVGMDESAKILKSRLFSMKPWCSNLMLSESMRYTTKKVRIVANNQQIVRYDLETPHPIGPGRTEDFLNLVRKGIDHYDVILISDYNKGVLTLEILEGINKIAKAAEVPVIVDPKGKNFSKYGKVTAITPNEREMIEAAEWHGVRDGGKDYDAVERASRLLHKLGLERMVVTCGSRGALVLEAFAGLEDAGINVTVMHSKKRHVYDVSGAGDTFLATFGYGVACGIGFKEAARIANIAAGIVVAKPGTSAVRPHELLAELRGHSGTSSSRVHEEPTTFRF